MKRILFVFAEIFLLAMMTATGCGASLSIHEKGGTGDFLLAAKGRAVSVWVDNNDFKVAQIAAGLFAEDVERVSGTKPAVIHSEPIGPDGAVLIGTLGHSPLIDRLVAEKKLDVSAIRNRWESYLIATVEHPSPGVKAALVIIGSDRRGTAYGVFTVSEAIGVSPWYWWADVAPVKHSELHVGAGVQTQGPPSVKYRGIFINDEFDGMHPWSTRTFEKDRKHIGPKTYAKIFELLLRLKANFCWPAMWGGARYFNIYPENKLVADDYGIVMGSSHCEALLFNNMEHAEWDEKTDGPWNFLTNRQKMVEAWEKRLKDNGKFENVYTIGLRGIHDRPIQGGTTTVEKKAILQQAIDEQRTLLGRYVNADITGVPQLFCPYREVLQLYEARLKVPDDVTLVWADDNYGYIRQLSTPEEQKRSGRSGVYYHLSFFLYTWLCPYSPSRIAYEMTKAYDFGADRVWVFNVGDIKPAEKELTFAMQMAWDIKRWTPENANGFILEWAGATFGKEYADEISFILREYYRLAARGMPEFLNRGGNCIAKYSEKEVADRIAAYGRIEKKAEELAQRLPENLRDAFFQLVLYPVRGAGLINERVFRARQSLELAAKGDAMALEFATQATKAAGQVKEITKHYNEVMSGGKWNHMMGGPPREAVPVATPEMVQDGKAGKAKLPPSLIEPEPAGCIEARAFARKHDGACSRVTVLPQMGFTDGVSVLPFTARPLEKARIEDGPWVEYDLDLPAGALTLRIRTLPTQRVYRGRELRYAVRLKDEKLTVFDIHSGEGEGLWWENIKRGYSFRELPYASDLPRKMKLRLYLPDPGVVLQDIQIFPSTSQSRPTR